jgi:hypothetical protein
MKTLIPLILASLIAGAIAQDGATSMTNSQGSGLHRYLIERTFPAGALEGLDAATKERVNRNNASVGVRWVESYANAQKTRTFCVYEGPSEDAVRSAAQLNGLPVDNVTEVPVTLLPN